MSRANRTTDFFMAGLDRGAGFAQQARQNRIQDEELKYMRDRRAVTDARDDSEYQYLTGRRSVLDKRSDEQAALESLYAPERAAMDAETQALQLESLRSHVEDQARIKRQRIVDDSMRRMFDGRAIEFLNRPESPEQQIALESMRENLGGDPTFTGPPAVLAGGEMGQTAEAGAAQMQSNAQGIARRAMLEIDRPRLLDQFYAENPQAIGHISPGLEDAMTGFDKAQAQRKMKELQLVVEDLIKQGALQFAPEVLDEADSYGMVIDIKDRDFATRTRMMAQQEDDKHEMLTRMGYDIDSPEYGRLMKRNHEGISLMFTRWEATETERAAQMGVDVDPETARLLLSVDRNKNIHLLNAQATWKAALGGTVENERETPQRRRAALMLLQTMGAITTGNAGDKSTSIGSPEAQRKQRAAQDARADAKYFEDEAANLKAQAEVIEEQLKETGWKPGDTPGKGPGGDKQRAMLKELAKIRDARRRALSDAATAKKTAAQGTRASNPEQHTGADQRDDQNADVTNTERNTMQTAEAAAAALRKVSQGGTNAATEQDAGAIAELIAQYEADNGMKPGTATDAEVDELIAGLLAIQHAQATPKQ